MVPVTVVTPAGWSSASDTAQFTYQSEAALPAVTGLDPAEGPESGGTSVVITGSGFTGATDVGFGDTEAADLQVDSDGQVTATSPAGSGTVSVTVTTPAGMSDPSDTAQFTYQSEAALPAVTGLDPAEGPESGGTSVVITGSGFTGATDVGFGDTEAADLQVDSDGQVTATSPAGSGTVSVTVITPAGTSDSSDTAQFTYQSEF